MEWERVLERERRRHADGLSRLDPGQLVRLGNTAYGAGLSLLMLGRGCEAATWLGRAAERWYQSFAHATPTSWGRPIGAIKASLLAGQSPQAAAYARWALEAGSDGADSAVGRYAAALAHAALGRWSRVGSLATGLGSDAGFPVEVARALGAIAQPDREGTAAAIGDVLASFEARGAFLEDVPVADTVLVLAGLARGRGLDPALPPSPLLPP